MRALVLAALAFAAPAALGQPAPAAGLPARNDAAQAPAAGAEAPKAAAEAPKAGSEASPAGPDALLAEVDARWPRRDEPGVLDEIRGRLDEAEKRAPKTYAVLWRQARLHFWIADDPGLEKGEKSRIGKIAWEYGDRAAEANPDGVEGWNYAAAGMGNYALGIGIFTALRQGIEGKFKERLGRAEKIDAAFENGAIQTAWGRFWYELPWPKYSAERSRRALEAALRRNPDNVRARVYLADLDLKEDEPKEARAELEKAVASPPGRYDAPEERRWQEVARKMLAAKGDPR